MTTEKWYPFVKLPLTPEQFRELPQNPSYNYEFSDSEAVLTAKPRCYHALLALEPCEPAQSVVGFGREEIRFRSMIDDDWPELTKLFAWAFDRVLPFSQLSDDDRKTASEECLHHTRSGGDGPLVKEACFVAHCDTNDGEQFLGAILITLVQKGDLERFDDATWNQQAPANAISNCWGRPHLTWVFTDETNSRHGIGTALLDHAASALLDLGYTDLASTFLLGNESSTLWHWRNGFRLMSYPSSPRATERRFTAKESQDRVDS